MTSPKEANNLTCAEFQAQLPELVGSGVDVNEHPHLQSCDLCRALLADLETIAEAARQLFPVEEPPDDLWSKIESGIKHDDEEPPGSDASGAPGHKPDGPDPAVGICDPEGPPVGIGDPREASTEKEASSKDKS
jgi:hypothetical protein